MLRLIPSPVIGFTLLPLSRKTLDLPSRMISSIFGLMSLGKMKRLVYLND